MAKSPPSKPNKPSPSPPPPDDADFGTPLSLDNLPPMMPFESLQETTKKVRNPNPTEPSATAANKAVPAYPGPRPVMTTPSAKSVAPAVKTPSKPPAKLVPTAKTRSPTPLPRREPNLVQRQRDRGQPHVPPQPRMPLPTLLGLLALIVGLVLIAIGAVIALSRS